MKLNEGVRGEGCPTCPICGSLGLQLYSELRDEMFFAPGVWSELRCPRDGHIWLSPRPVIEDIGKVYEKYYTHTSFAERPSPHSVLREAAERILREQEFGDPAGPRRRRMLAWLIRRIPMMEELFRRRMMWLTPVDGPKLVEIGCGKGEFLIIMRDLGWNCRGVERDPTAAAIAQQRLGQLVTEGKIEDARFSGETIDAVTADHVIEHLHDPIAFLRESFRILRPGGKLVVLTPNSTSLGHRIFRASWRGLEPPRHLHIFCAETLRTCAEQAGFTVQTLRTTACSATEIWCFSRLIRRKVDFSLGLSRHVTFLLRVEALAFQLFEHTLRSMGREIGESLLLIAYKPGANRPSRTARAEPTRSDA